MKGLVGMVIPLSYNDSVFYPNAYTLTLIQCNISHSCGLNNFKIAHIGNVDFGERADWHFFQRLELTLQEKKQLYQEHLTMADRSCYLVGYLETLINKICHFSHWFNNSKSWYTLLS